MPVWTRRPADSWTRGHLPVDGTRGGGAARGTDPPLLFASPAGVPSRRAVPLTWQCRRRLHLMLLRIRPPPPPAPPTHTHTPKLTGMGMPQSEVCRRPARGGRRGGAAALLSRGTTTVPLSPVGNALPRWIGTRDVDDSFLKPPNWCAHPDAPPAHLLNHMAIPPTAPPTRIVVAVIVAIVVIVVAYTDLP